MLFKPPLCARCGWNEKAHTAVVVTAALRLEQDSTPCNRFTRRAPLWLRTLNRLLSRATRTLR